MDKARDRAESPFKGFSSWLLRPAFFRREAGSSFFADSKLGRPNEAPLNNSGGSSMKLSEVAEGSLAKVLKVRGGGAIRQRLLDMGVGKGALVKVVRYAPLKDPVQVSVRGYDLALRVLECSMIDVEPLPPGSSKDGLGDV